MHSSKDSMRAAHGLAFVTEEAADVKNVDPALSASITFQVMGFVFLFCLSTERAFSFFFLLWCDAGYLMRQEGHHPFIKFFKHRFHCFQIIFLRDYLSLYRLNIVILIFHGEWFSCKCDEAHHSLFLEDTYV